MKRFGNWLGLLLTIIVVGAFLGLSLYLDAKSIPTPGEVTTKRETINFGSRRSDSWSRRTAVEVRYQPVGHYAPLTANITVDLATYDRLHVGSPVVVRYPDDPRFRDFLFLPLARLDGQTTWTVIRTALPPGTGRVVLLVLGALVLLKLWTWLRGRVRGLGWLLVAYLLGAALFLFFPWPDRAESGPRDTALATVRSIRPVHYLPGSRGRRGSTLLQPYDFVVLEYVPQGRADPVVTVDAVDAGSVLGLAPGRTIAVNYVVGDVRSASIEGGRRTYRQRNLLSWGLFWFGGIALVVVGFLISAALREFFAKRLSAALARAQQARNTRR